MGDNQVAALLLVVGSIASAIYLIPTIVAAKRSHPQAWPIFLLNLLLGWTLVFWVLALVWSAMRLGVNSGAPAPSAASEIERLRLLREKGVLTEDEFTVLKSRIAGG